MLKRDRSSVGSERDGSRGLVLKRHRSSLVELVVPHDVVELILERLPVESLVRFKSVSKSWKSTIESHLFQERQFIRRMQSRGPDVLSVFLSFSGTSDVDVPNTVDERIVLGSSVACTFRFPVTGSMICHGSCDGLLCTYCVYTPSVVVNPATGWHQTFPLSNLQKFLADRYDKHDYVYATPRLGFGKDKLKGTYKPVWLYNPSDFGGLDSNVTTTTCEVFDFSTNAWRYVHPASPYRVNNYHYPVYLDGSLHWLTECEEPKVLSFDLHTETFQVISKAPISPERDEPYKVIMCILDNRLCVCERKGLTQVIWSFDDSSSGGNKTWKKLYSLDLTGTLFWFHELNFPLAPIAILDKNKILLQGRDCLEQPMIHDLHANSYELLFGPETSGYPVYYYQSLFSALST
ncbi:PREDICTED: F-box protein At1g11270-like [Camelina sativa]|uniref:F-box protein At1g11270-like n=1 Tax=Camelina sativa TaxID=90675 RepID=A0ABM0VMP6_CAMSA|nr:PREDICTED: F-box protein At1g11270-like [Camelina sativa]